MNSFIDDFLIGLDLIKIFRLKQDENLEISQKYYKEEEVFSSNRKLDTELKDQENIESTLRTYEINFNEHVKTEDFEMKINYLKEHERMEINKLIERYDTVFAKNKYDVGQVKGTTGLAQSTPEKSTVYLVR